MAEPHVRWSTDLITFFAPDHWGLPADLDYDAWTAAVDADPRPYLERMLDEAKATGVEAIELAPDPAGWEQALKVYGSGEALRAELDARGLGLSSSYHSGWVVIGRTLAEPAFREQAVAEIRAHARFLKAAGGELIVLGSVERELGTGPAFERTDQALIDTVAALLEEFGRTAREEGVRIALHTDAYSIWSRNVDLDRVMAATDPALVSLCIDSGHMTLDGGDAVQALRDHVARVPIMHWKDCHTPLRGETLTTEGMERHALMLTHFRILGTHEGLMDWEAWMRVLAANRWTGWGIAEIDMSPDPIGEVRHGLAFYRDRLAPLLAP